MNKSIHGLIAAIIFVGLVIALAIYQKPEGRYQGMRPVRAIWI